MKNKLILLMLFLIVIGNFFGCSEKKSIINKDMKNIENEKQEDIPLQSSQKEEYINKENENKKYEENKSQEDIVIQYLNEFESKIKYYDFIYEDPTYGALYILVDKNKYEIIVGEKLLEIKEDNILRKSTYDSELRSETLIEDLREERVKAINYLIIDRESKKGTGCVVLERFFSVENCIFNDSENKDRQIIYNNLNLNPFPKLPEDWLREFVGKVPINRKEKMLYKDNSKSYSVEYLFFKNNDGTETKMYVHSTYKIPLAVEILKDEKVINKYIYEAFTPNRHNLMEWRKNNIPRPSQE